MVLAPPFSSMLNISIDKTCKFNFVEINNSSEEYKNDANECHCATNDWASLKSSLGAYNNLSQ